MTDARADLLKRLMEGRRAGDIDEKEFESLTLALLDLPRDKSSSGLVSDGAYHCSFCGKSQHRVRMLISGPSVYICDECIVLCREIIDLEKVVTSRAKK